MCDTDGNLEHAKQQHILESVQLYRDLRPCNNIMINGSHLHSTSISLNPRDCLLALVYG